MNNIGKPERLTQQRVIQLFQHDLGYQYLGDWTDRAGNSNIEDGLLTAFLQASGYTTTQASRVLEALHREADNPNRSLMANNQAVYKLLRYGVSIKLAVGDVTETVPLRLSKEGRLVT